MRRNSVKPYAAEEIAAWAFSLFFLRTGSGQSSMEILKVKLYINKTNVRITMHKAGVRITGKSYRTVLLDA